MASLISFVKHQAISSANYKHCYLKLGSYAQFATCTRGANLHPGCIFGHMNGVLRICTRVVICKLVLGYKFASTFEVEQIYLHPDANLHPGAIRAYERKMINFYTF